MAAGTLLVAVGSFACEHEGREIVVRVGERIAAEHPLAKKHAAMFVPVEPTPDIERSAPRANRRPRR
jgi:hypothetical protein